MEGLSLPVSIPRTRVYARGASVLKRLRGQVTTTPGKLLLVSTLVIAGALCFGVVATVAEQSRAQAAQSARTQTEPLLVQAARLYTTLSDANATVTTTFLKGGLEPPSQRAHYLQDLQQASDSLATLTRETAGSATARTAVKTVTERLPNYSGLVEAARANNRQGFPVGAAYLRAASNLLTGTVLPEADRLYATEAERLSGDYRTGTASASLIVLVVIVLAALGLLLLAQVYLARISRRILNVPIVIATGLLTAVSIWSIVALIGESNALDRAQRDGSDSVEVLSATRVLVSRAQSDQSLILVSRGSDETDPLDFAQVKRILAPPKGLVGEVEALATRTGSVAAANRLSQEFQAFVSATAGSPASSASAARLTDDLGAQIRAAQGRFMISAGDATSALSGLWLAIPLLTALAALLAVAGLRQRLGEYR